ncbi:MAG TPA: carbon-nitrogen hydrolase family protein [Solirubrobacterales bacterium]|nr:carbon-nitrogen hydrolase family protein [Solirubrobacterales bacterium]
MRAAAVQLNSTDEYDRNLEVAERLIRGAAAEGAELVVLPEKWTVLGSPEAIRSCAEPLDGPALTAAAGWARELGIYLVAGSVPEVVPEWEKLANTSVMFGPDGEQRATYRKIHMFDVDVGDVTYRESEVEQAGTEIALGDAGGTMVGLTICYDLRFPELYRILALRGARVITVPSAFTERTGRDHWEILIRARAIEDQVFVIAAGQIGSAPPRYRSYGRSMIVDPWGVVLAQAADTECFVSADLDFAIQNETRERLPSLRHRRPEAYRWPENDPSADAPQASVGEPATAAGAP